MDKMMVDQWNSVVTEHDEVFFVGDFSFTSAERTVQLLDELRGTKHLIIGNHDKGRSKGFWNKFFVTVEESRRIFIEPIGTSINLCHYPTFGPQAPQLLIHGHSHNYRPLITTYATTRQLLINVSVECIEYTPISEDKISVFIEQHEQYFKENYG
jgi:calcineurin-like phosphoesterase family protein